VHVLLVLQVLNINILLLDHWRRFRIKHSSVPILMKESPKSFIGASLHIWAIAGLVAEMHHIHEILLAIIHDLLIGVDHGREDSSW
jgi:hypothetical protein